MRYNPKERIGVNKAEQIFIEEFEWIFREQAIVDVGIDAFVEQAENGEPKGKFLALQIKTGEGNFHISSDKITYYISKVHYEYWTNFDLPLILVAYLPEDKTTYWQEISTRKIKKTGKRWKIEIPKKNLLNSQAKFHLTKLLSDKYNTSTILKVFQGENIDKDSIYELDSKIDLIADATESTIKLVDILENFQIKIKASGEKFRQHSLKGDAISSPQVKNTIKSFAKDITLGARRLEQEISIFSEVFGEGFYAFEQAIILHYSLTKDVINLKQNLESLEIISPALESAISGVEVMKKGFEDIPKDIYELRYARTNSLQVVDLIINEYRDAKEMTDNLIQQIRITTK